MNKLWLYSTYLLVTGCVTSQPVARLDKSKKFVEIQSTSDKGTALPKIASESKISTAATNLRDKVFEQPRSVTSLLNLARIHLSTGKLKLAEKYTRKAIKIDLQNKEARKILAQLHYRRGSYDMAKIILNNIDAQQDQSMLNLHGLIATKQKKYAEALGYFSRAIKIDPSNISVRMNLGVLFVKYKQLKKAATQFERILKVAPQHNDAKLHLAIIKSNLGDLKAAETLYSEVLSSSPSNPIATYNYGVLLEREGEYEDAITYIQKYLSSPYAKSRNNSEAFALIENIKLKTEASKSGISDDEIQAMASEMSSDNSQEVAEKETMENESTETAEDEPVGQNEEIKAQNEDQPDSSNTADETGGELDEISELEKALE